MLFRASLASGDCKPRKVGAVLLEQNDERAAQRARHMPRDTMAKVLNQPTTALPLTVH